MDIYNTLPISAGMLGEAVGETIMGISGLIIRIVFATGAATWYVGNEKVDGRKMRQASI